MTDPVHLTPGSVFHGRYEVVRCIKTGGMGAVYEVLDQRTRRRRALKVMLPSVVADRDLRARFVQEATITADIDSEHIVETFDANVDDSSGVPFIVMELLKGEDLGATLQRQHCFSPAETVALLLQVGLALDRTHAAGVVHRDLKPENLFFTRTDDGSPKIKVLDFGIAKLVAGVKDPANTRAVGTPLFMAPEQIRGDGDIGPRADLYALGHIAYTLLVGEAYWRQDSDELAMFTMLQRIIGGISEPPHTRAARRRGVRLSSTFDTWFARAVAPAPEHRFETASALVAGLAACLGVQRGNAASSLAIAPAPGVAPSGAWGPAVPAITNPAAPGSSGPQRYESGRLAPFDPRTPQSGPQDGRPAPGSGPYDGRPAPGSGPYDARPASQGGSGPVHRSGPQQTEMIGPAPHRGTTTGPVAADPRAMTPLPSGPLPSVAPKRAPMWPILIAACVVCGVAVGAVFAVRGGSSPAPASVTTSALTPPTEPPAPTPAAPEPAATMAAAPEPSAPEPSAPSAPEPSPPEPSAKATASAPASPAPHPHAPEAAKIPKKRKDVYGER